MRRIGYIRLSPSGPPLETQQAALDASPGVAAVHVEQVSAAFAAPGILTAFPPALSEAIAALEQGDELVVPTPSRLASTRAVLVGALTAIAARGAGLRVAGAAAPLDWNPMIVDFVRRAESEVRQETTQRMRERKAATGGTSGPRPRLVEGEPNWARAKAAWDDPARSVASIAREFGVGRMTLYRVFGRKRG